MSLFPMPGIPWITEIQKGFIGIDLFKKDLDFQEKK
jgi:hypothetical protein